MTVTTVRHTSQHPSREQGSEFTQSPRTKPIPSENWHFFAILVLGGILLFGYTHYSLELEKAKLQSQSEIEIEKAKLLEGTKRTTLEHEWQEREVARLREEYKRAEEVARLNEPGKQLKRENSELIARGDGNTSVLDRINPDKISIYSQSAIFECSKEDVSQFVAKTFYKLPSFVSMQLGKILSSIDSPFIFWDRVYEVDHLSGEGYFYDVKFRSNVSQDRIAVAMRTAGTSFKRRDVVIGYKEEKIAKFSKRKVKGLLTKKADCGEKTKSGARCIFPFNYDGKRFEECTNYGSIVSLSVLWCATDVDGTGSKQAYDYCHSPSVSFYSDCVETSEAYGAVFEYNEEEYVSGLEPANGAPHLA